MLPLILLAAFLTAIVSGVFGMAGGLMLMGALAFLLPVEPALALHGLIQSVANGSRAALLWRFVDGRVLAIYVGGAAAAVAVVVSLAIVLPKAWLFVVLGLTPALAWVPKKRLNLDAARPAHAVACGFLVTGLNVVAGVSGPLLDVFFVRTERDRRAIVATKAATQVISHGVKIVYYGAPLALADPQTSRFLLTTFAACVPLTLLGTWAGGRILHRLDDVRFRDWTKWIVSALGLAYIVRGVVLLAG